MHNMETVSRVDRVEITEPKIDQQGFLHLDATVTRVGVFKYILPDGKIRREYRPKEDVLSTKNLESIKKTIITNEHPPKGQRVTSKNVKQLAVGFADSNIRVDENFVRVGLVITDEKAIEEVQKNKKREVSCGYDCVIEDTAGIWDGPDGPEPYDVIQRGHVNNHIAITKQGRAGKDVRLHIDSAMQLDNDEEIIMTKFEVDGLSFDLEPGIAVSIKSALDKRDSQLKDKETEISKLQGERDQLKETLKTKEVEKKDATDEDIRKLVRDRIELLDKVRPFLPAEELNKHDSSDLELKKMCLMKHTSLKQEELDTKTDAYIDARFDALLEVQSKERTSGIGLAIVKSIPQDFKAEQNKKLAAAQEKTLTAYQVKAKE